MPCAQRTLQSASLHLLGGPCPDCFTPPLPRGLRHGGKDVLPLAGGRRGGRRVALALGPRASGLCDESCAAPPMTESEKEALGARINRLSMEVRDELTKQL